MERDSGSETQPTGDHGPSDTPAPPGPPALPPPDVDIAGWIQAAWKLVIREVGTAVALPLIIIVPTVGFAMLAYFGSFLVVVLSGPPTHVPKAVPTTLGLLLGALTLLLACVMPALHAGVYACFREGMRTGRLTADLLWSGFRHWWACTWVSWTLWVAALLCLPLCPLLVGIPLLVGVATLGWLALFRIVDKGQGGAEALTFAWNALRGRLWMMLIYSLLVGVLTSAGVMGMYVGLLFTVPLGIAAYAAAYEDLRRKVEGEAGT